jgi:hypothetical protein
MADDGAEIVEPGCQPSVARARSDAASRIAGTALPNVNTKVNTGHFPTKIGPENKAAGPIDPRLPVSWRSCRPCTELVVIRPRRSLTMSVHRYGVHRISAAPNLTKRNEYC